MGAVGVGSPQKELCCLFLYMSEGYVVCTGEGYHGPKDNSDEEDLSTVDMEDGKDFDIEELKDATYRALIPPMDKDELFEIKAKVCSSLLLKAYAMTDFGDSDPCICLLVQNCIRYSCNISPCK